MKLLGNIGIQIRVSRKFKMHVDRGRITTDTSLDPPSVGMNGVKEYQTTLKGFFFQLAINTIDDSCGLVMETIKGNDIIIPHAIYCVGYNVFDPSFCLSACSSVCPVLDFATPLKEGRKIPEELTVKLIYRK